MNSPLHEPSSELEPAPHGQAALFLDFENLVLGAGRGQPRQATPVPSRALARLCREFGCASVRRAYADWGDRRFGRYQEILAMNGVDLIQVGRFGAQIKNGADIQMTVDAMETLIVHPAVTVFVLVTGDSDFTPLVRRLREFGKWVVGVGADASASRRLVAVSSEYRYWTSLTAEAGQSACIGADLAVDSAAEKLLVRAFEEIAGEAPTASAIKGKMLALDPSFDEHDYGCDGFRDFLGRFPRLIERTGRSGNDITITLTGHHAGELR